MSIKNDERVLELQKEIQKKKRELEPNRFIPETNCILCIEGNSYNINILQEKELEILLVRLNMYAMSAKELNINLEISGYSIQLWMNDIRNKLNFMTNRKKMYELKELEQKLNNMLSDEKKADMELDRIAAILK